MLLVLQKAFWSAGADAREQMRCWCKLGLGCCEPIGAPCSGVAFNSYFKKKRLKLEGLWRADEGSGEEGFILLFFWRCESLGQTVLSLLLCSTRLRGCSGK